jgi:hypothetical protein
MAALSFGPGVGGMLFSGGGGAAGGATEPVQVGGGKNSHAQNLVSPHSGMKSTITKGEPLSRSMSQYGKGHQFSSGTALNQIRGGKGQMRHIQGGLGPGRTGGYAGGGNYASFGD